jgi:hypothetical protein
MRAEYQQAATIRTRTLSFTRLSLKCKKEESIMGWKVLLFILFALGAAVAAVLFYGKLHWESGTRKLRGQLETARLPIEPRVFNRREIETLPAPVQRYFQAVLTDGQPIVASVSVEHVGTFNMGETTEQWKPFTSTQRVVTRRPGFDWDGRVAMMPGLSVYVHDAYVAGEGILQVAVLGLVSMVNLRGTREMAQGELMRWFAEAAWYPTALLPGQGVHWKAVDAHSSLATLKDGNLTLTLRFHFDEAGLIDTVSAEARGRTVGNAVVQTPWQGRFWNYAMHDGMLVPMDAEVAWLLPEGAKPYWRGHINSVNYTFAQ